MLAGKALDFVIHEDGTLRF